MTILYTPRAKRVLAIANKIAGESGHNYIGAEHILLGALECNDGLAAKLIEQVGLSRADLYAKLLAKFREENPPQMQPDGKNQRLAQLLREVADELASA